VEEAIALKQRLIELLEEQGAIVINQAVTKGLNPNAPIKDSGIDWLGDIPAHWEVKKLKYVSKYNQFTLDENTDPNLEISYIDIGSVSQGNINKTQNYLFKNAPSRARRKSQEEVINLMATDLDSQKLGTHKLSGKLSGLLSCSCGYDCRIVF